MPEIACSSPFLLDFFLLLYAERGKKWKSTAILIENLAVEAFILGESCFLVIIIITNVF